MIDRAQGVALRGGVLRDLLLGSPAGRTTGRSLLLIVALTITLGMATRSCAPIEEPLTAGHPSISLEIAFNWVLCRQPSHLSDVHSLGAYLRDHSESMTTPLQEVARLQAGSLDAYCRTATTPFLNSENSFTLVTAAVLALNRSSSLASLERTLYGVVVGMSLLFAFVLFRAGSGLPLVAGMVVTSLLIFLDLEPVRFSQYSLILPAVLLDISWLALALSVPRRFGLPRQALVVAVAGFLAGFTVNVRTSYLPTCVLLVTTYTLLAFALKRKTSNRQEPRLPSWLAASVAAFIAGFVLFHISFIARLTPAVGAGHSTHPVAHPLVLGLAVPMNDLARTEGIAWNDEVGLTLAQRAIPDATYLGPLYERALFAYYRSLWRAHPREMVRVYAAKFALAGRPLLEQSDRPLYGGRWYSTALLPLRGLPTGLLIIALLAAVAVHSTLRCLREPSLSAFVLASISTAALLVQVESSVIMPEFSMRYQSVLLFGLIVVCLSGYEAAAPRLAGMREWAAAYELDILGASAIGMLGALGLFVLGRNAARQANAVASWIDSSAIATAGLYGLLAFALYLLFRCAVGRTLSTAGTTAVIVSTARFLQTPSLLNVAGSILIVGALAAITWMVVRDRDISLVFQMVAVVGVLIGLANGLQAVLIPMWVVTLVLVAVIRLPKANPVRHRAAAAALFVAVATLVGWLTGSSPAASRPRWVAVLDQFSSAHDGTLGLRRNPFSFDPAVSNGSDAALVQAFSLAHERSFSAAQGPAANHVTRGDVMQVIRLFPADFMARVYAAVHANLSNASTRGDITDRLLRPEVPPVIRRVVVGVSLIVATLAVPLVASIALIAGAVFFRTGLWALLGVVYLTATLGSTLSDSISGALAQWGALVFACGALASALPFGGREGLRSKVAAWRRTRSLGRTVLNGAVFMAAVVVALGSALFVARAYQTRTIHRLVSSFSTVSPDHRTAAAQADMHGNIVRIALPTGGRRGRRLANDDFVAADFGSAACHDGALDVRVRSVSVTGEASESQMLRVRLPREPLKSTVLYLPASPYRASQPDEAVDPEQRFMELEMSRAGCLSEVGLARRGFDTAVAFPMQVPDDWQAYAAYDRFERWEPARLE
jgi:hypothetical protein